MENQKPSYRREICRIYRLVDNPSLRYLSVNHLHELGIEAKPVELTRRKDKLQFDPCFFEPQHLNLHETYPPKEDKAANPNPIPELTFVPSWDRCLRQAADQMARWVSVGYRTSKQIEADEEELFCCARYFYDREIKYADPDLWIDRAQNTLLHMEALLRAQRDGIPGPPQHGFDHCYLSDLSPLSHRWRYVYEYIHGNIQG